MDSQNYNNTIRYDLIDSLGNTASYIVRITVFNGLPKVEIETEGQIPVLSKTENVKASIRISNCPEYGVIESSGKIRGRGNFTWERYPKKPYKIKFSEKKSPFGFAANKDWVLMAEYLDHSLLRTAYMCEVSKAIGLDFTSNYQYVDFFLNKEYLETYIFADFVEKAKKRINIENDGFIIECDNRWYEEPLSFPSSILMPASVRNSGAWITQHFTFKYPDADDGDIIENDDNYNYITNFIYGFDRSVT